VSFAGTTLQLSNIEALSFDDTYARLTTYVSSDGRTHLGTEVLGDTINGSADNDYIDGRAGNDVLNGGSGADVIRGGAGDDTIDGGGNASGLDVAVYAGNFADYTISSTGGTYTVTDTNAADGNDGTDTLTGIEALQFGDQFVRVAIESVPTTLSASGQYLYGTILGEALDGSADADGILGRAGNDTINAGGGDDFVDGGEGNDIIDIGDGANVIRWSTGDGNDMISGFTADDVLNIKGGIGRNNASLSIAVTGGNTIITIDGTATLTLVGVTSLTDSNFGTG
jgi:Ca2+-binding RTX toxin-like protein